MFVTVFVLLIEDGLGSENLARINQKMKIIVHGRDRMVRGGLIMPGRFSD